MIFLGKTAYRGKYTGKCPSKNVPSDWLDEKVWADCIDYINNPGQLLEDLSPEEEIADLAQAEQLTALHVAEAIHFRNNMQEVY